MALTLIKEDGTGLTNANSYANVADGDAYHDGHVNNSQWTGATNDKKEQALVMATRLIDELWQFNGWRATDAQALQWPRERCPDPDKGLPVSVLFWNNGEYVDFDVVPKPIVDATCEMARELIVLDRTLTPEGEGLHSTDFSSSTHDADGSGGSDNAIKVYDKTDTRRILTRLVEAILSKFGAPIRERAGMVRLIRS